MQEKRVFADTELEAAAHGAAEGTDARQAAQDRLGAPEAKEHPEPRASAEVTGASAVSQDAGSKEPTRPECLQGTEPEHRLQDFRYHIVLFPLRIPALFIWFIRSV